MLATKKQKKAEVAKKPYKTAPRAYNCMICGVACTTTHGRKKTCDKPECEKARKEFNWNTWLDAKINERIKEKKSASHK